MSLQESLTIESADIEQDYLAKEIVNRWTEWKSARRAAESRWKEVTNYVYATSTRETTNAYVGGQDGEGWSHSTHIPKLTQIFDNLIANYRYALFPNEDWFKFVGEDKEAATLEKRTIAEAYLRTKHRLSGFEVKVLDLLKDWGIYGNCFAEVTYESRTAYDNDGGQYIDYMGPVVNRISPYDIVFNPMATSFEDSPKIIRSVQSMGEFLRTVEENPERNYDPKVVEKMKHYRSEAYLSGEGETDKGEQMIYDGYGTWSQYIRSGHVEILDFYGDIWDANSQTLMKSKVLTVVDRCWVLREENIDTPSGRPRIYHAGWRERPDNLWAMGPLDNLIGMQYQINHLENAKADALDQMIFATRVIVGDVEESDVMPGKPGGEYRIPAGEGSVSNLAPDTTILQVDFMNQAKLQLMEEMAGSPREAMGIRTPGEKTAFEVNSLQNAASRNFQNKINQFESSFLDKLLNAEFEVARRYLSTGDKINYKDRTFGADLFKDITPEDIRIQGKLVPMGARHFAREQQLMANATQLLQIAAQDPEVMSHFPSKKLAKMYEELLGLDKLDLFQEWGRIMEQQELQQLMNAAQAQTEVSQEEAIEQN